MGPMRKRHRYVQSGEKSPYERATLTLALESFIRARRRYVFRLPKPGSSVVLLLSGGMDSAAAWHMLATRFRLTVYPFSVVSGPLDPQYRAVGHIAAYMRKQRAGFFREPKILFVRAQQALTPVFRPELMSPSELLGSFRPEHGLFELPRFWGNTMMYAHWAYLYAQKLRVEERIPIDTVLCGVTSDDGRFVPSQTLTNMRLIMATMMQISQEDSWQFGSVFYEPSVRADMTKAEVTRYLLRTKMPMRHTYSCDRKGILHCGTCLSCQSRKYCIQKAGRMDGTWYLDRNPVRTVARYVFGRD